MLFLQGSVQSSIEVPAELVDNLLKLYYEENIRAVFDKFRDQPLQDVSHYSEAPTRCMSFEKLRSALEILGSGHQAPSEQKGDWTFDDFKKMLLKPTEVELWCQTLPLANLLARCFGEINLSGLEALHDHQINHCLEVYCCCAKTLIRERINKFKLQQDKLQKTAQLPGNNKFGTHGFKMEGGNVHDFHRGLTERIGTIQNS
jgi:hypothetical protein